MKGSLTQRMIEGKAPTGMVGQQLDGFTVRNPLGKLQNTEAQREQRFNSRTTVFGAISRDQLRPHLDQAGINLFGKDAEAVVGAERLTWHGGSGKEQALGAEVGQAHRERCKGALDMQISNRLSSTHASRIFHKGAGDSLQKAGSALLRQFSAAFGGGARFAGRRASSVAIAGSLGVAAFAPGAIQADQAPKQIGVFQQNQQLTTS